MSGSRGPSVPVPTQSARRTRVFASDCGMVSTNTRASFACGALIRNVIVLLAVVLMSMTLTPGSAVAVICGAAAGAVRVATVSATAKTVSNRRIGRSPELYDVRMIVRPAGDHLHLITQPDHAALAGRIMEPWIADDLPPSPPRV